MNKLTKCFIAVSMLGTGAIGAGIALSANANEYDPIPYDHNYNESTEIEIPKRDGTVSGFVEFREEDGYWILINEKGEVLDSGEYNSDAEISVTSITQTITEDDEVEIIDINVEFFETEEELDAWTSELDWYVESE